jgi:hypothetical protein
MPADDNPVNSRADQEERNLARVNQVSRNKTVSNRARTNRVNVRPVADKTDSGSRAISAAAGANRATRKLPREAAREETRAAPAYPVL